MRLIRRLIERITADDSPASYYFMLGVATLIIGGDSPWPSGGIESFPEGDEPPQSKCSKCGEVAEQDEYGRDFCRECYPKELCRKGQRLELVAHGIWVLAGTVCAVIVIEILLVVFSH